MADDDQSLDVIETRGTPARRRLCPAYSPAPGAAAAAGPRAVAAAGRPAAGGPGGPASSGASSQGSGRRRSSASEATAFSDEVDAWSLENWDSPSSVLKGTPSPCGGAQGLDDRLRKVADVVHAELQVDAEALVHRAMSEMNSWISEEIAFARQGLKEELQQLVAGADAERAEKDACREGVLEELRASAEAQVADARRSEADLAAKVKTLEQGLQQQTEELQLLLRVSAEAGSGQPVKSFSVAEARQLAEERKWRLRLDGLQEGIDKQLSSIQALERQSVELASQIARHEAELRKCSTASQKVADHVEELHAVRLLVEKTRGEADAAKDGLSALEASVAAVSDAVAGGEAALRGVEASWSAELAAAVAATRQSALDAVEKLEAGLAVAETERLAELRVVCEKVETQGADVEQALASRDAQVAEISGQLSELLAGEERVGARMEQLARLAEALDGRDARFEGLEADLQQGLAAKASADDVREAAERLHAWVDEVRDKIVVWSQQAHGAAMAELEATKAATTSHGVTLLRHSRTLEHISSWCEQLRNREQGLTYVILHVLEQGSPELVKLFERALTVPDLNSKQRQ